MLTKSDSVPFAGGCMRICIECKHVKMNGDRARCCRPEFPRGKVNGAIMGNDCADERNNEGEIRCGSDGRYFEPSLGSRLIHLFTREDF